MRGWTVGIQIEGSTSDSKPMKPGNSVEEKTSTTRMIVWLLGVRRLAGEAFDEKWR